MTQNRLQELKSRVKTREFCVDEWNELIEEIERLQSELEMYEQIGDAI